MPLEPLDVLVMIRAVAGNGMLTAAQRFDRVEALIAQGRALLAPAAPPARAPEEPTHTRRTRRDAKGD